MSGAIDTDNSVTFSNANSIPAYNAQSLYFYAPYSLPVNLLSLTNATFMPEEKS